MVATYQGVRPKIVWQPETPIARLGELPTIRTYTDGDDPAPYLGTFELVDGTLLMTVEGNVAIGDAGGTLAAIVPITGLIPGQVYVVRCLVSYTPGSDPTFGHQRELSMAWNGALGGAGYSNYDADGSNLAITATADGAGVIEVWLGERSIQSLDTGYTAIFSAPVVESGESTGPFALEFGYPLFDARSWGSPSPGAEAHLYPSGEEDAWIDEDDEFLDGVVAHVPAEDMTTNYGPQSGWNGAHGWQAFLEFARKGNVFEFWRDADVEASKLTCYLIEPRREPQGELGGMLRRFPLRLRSATNARFTGY